MRRNGNVCPLCKKVIYICDKLVMIQLVRFLGFEIRVNVIVVCYDCGVGISEEIELLKKKVV
jgi:hypothetical protein